MVAPVSSTPIFLSKIQELVGGTLHGKGTVTVSSLASLSDATSQSLSFVTNDKTLNASGEIRAGALLIHRHVPEMHVPQIVVPNPMLAFAKVAQAFFVPAYASQGISSDVSKGSNVTIGADPSIWPFVTLG